MFSTTRRLRHAAVSIFLLGATALPALADDGGARAPDSSASKPAPAARLVVPVTVESAPAPAAGPTAARASIALRPSANAPIDRQHSLDEFRRGRSGLQQSQVLMIVGAATFVTGAIIGDDVGTLFMVGGAGIGLWGLYNYLK
jgi:hypothetical protein